MEHSLPLPLPLSLLSILFLSVIHLHLCSPYRRFVSPSHLPPCAAAAARLQCAPRHSLVTPATRLSLLIYLRPPAPTQPLPSPPPLLLFRQILTDAERAMSCLSAGEVNLANLTLSGSSSPTGRSICERMSPGSGFYDLAAHHTHTHKHTW